MELDKKQTQIVCARYKHLFILAGAGSGKTRVIVEKIKFILENKEINEDEILCITFTVKASTEMHERLGKKNIDVMTFHKLAYEMIKKYKNNNIKVYDGDGDNKFSKEDILKISSYKNSFKNTLFKPFLIKKYNDFLLKNCFYDFDDLLLILLKMLKSNYNNCYYDLKYKYIFIDEFQDTNNLQYNILKALTKKDTQTLAVGDPDQAIYSFRGSNYKIIDKYVKDFNASVVTLDTNYRSNVSIINCANNLIKHNMFRHKKTLFPNKGGIGSVIYKNFTSKDEENIFIINELNILKTKHQLKEIAITYRNHMSKSLVISCLEKYYFSYSEDKDNSSNAISLLTIHETKGLEFEVVFIIDINDYILPDRKNDSIFNTEEERRLFFVGITRAKEILYLISNNENGKISAFINQTKH
ncbi:MAG: ATP-dependent helicase [Acholeplasmatales bacterium]|jgi:DNA helicase-2/ATP-dependent DNA helicase PcrA|nr:ATP-dependent helicase [Acholeplasmatales bacterium]